MTTAKGYRSEIAGAVYEMMSGAYDAGVVLRATLRTFNAACMMTFRLNHALAIEDLDLEDYH